MAALLFPTVGATGVATLRLGFSAVVLVAVARPRLRGYRRADWAAVVAFGLSLAGMNHLFYEAIARIPLGTAVTLEILGPLLLSVVAGRRLLSYLWAVLALAGVALLAGAAFGALDPVGVAFALGAGGMWAAYVLLSERAGRHFPRLDGLALAMVVAAAVSLPLGVGAAGDTLLQPAVLAVGLAVALLSSTVPYGLELLSLRTLPAATFAVLLSLNPVVAAVAGYLVLGQALTLAEYAAVLMVVTASIGAVLTTPSRVGPPRASVDEVRAPRPWGDGPG